MKLVILAASGRTGRELVRQAVERGHDVTAIVRAPERFSAPSGVTVLRGNVTQSLTLPPDTIVLSALGTERAGVLHAGARAVLATNPQRVIWLGAYGSGASARAAGWATRTLLKLMGDRLKDKVDADNAVLAAGGTVFHAGPLSDGDLSRTRHAVALTAAPARFFPARVARASVAALMLDEAERPRFERTIALPLD